MTTHATRARSRTKEGADLPLLAAGVGLLFIANPLVNTIAPGIGDLMTGGAMVVSLLPILARTNRFPWLAWSLFAFVAAYSVGLLYTGQAAQGRNHLLATASASAALMLFATYGREIVAMRGFRQLAYPLILASLFAVNFAGLNKNLLGGTMLYIGAMLVSLLIYSRPKSLWFYSMTFVGSVVLVAVILDFRSMIAYSLVILLGYWGATRLPSRAYWLAGIAGLVAVVGTVTWYFLNVYTNPWAYSLTLKIAEVSGRRANSGRDVLWGAITRAVSDGHQWLGLGTGMLPQDLLVTTLSSHSTFMQTYLQLGIFGLILLVLLLLAVWRLLAFAKTPSGKFGAAVFLMFVAHNSTEVLMFQNALLAAIPAWCAIGLAISLSRDMPEPVAPKPKRDRTYRLSD